jgi:hypothetical protein
LTDGSGNVFALSNNHVYADVNQAAIGDAVIQPGTFDGGAVANDTIGNLANFVAIDFTVGAENRVDAAIASTTTYLLGNSTPSGEGYGTPSSTTVGAVLGQSVTKYGRTTGSTNGKVEMVNATVNVDYDESGIALFTGQVIIAGKGRSSFSAGGDSGSLIVTRDGSNPIALLFAGNGQITVASPIDDVLGAFSFSIDGDTSPPPPPPPPTGGTSTVDSITYSTSGGKNADKDLRVTVHVTDANNAGADVADAAVSISLTHESGGSPATGTGTTGTDGTVTFRLRNATAGEWTTVITNVVANRLGLERSVPVYFIPHAVEVV